VAEARSTDVFLSHGASGSAATMLPWVDALGRNGIRAATVPAAGKLPMKVEKAVIVYRETIAGQPGAIIGGVSYGGRVASMLAADGDEIGGLVLLSYPLHPPGKPDQQRLEHLARIRVPVLFLSGESDPFARMDLLRAAVATVPGAELATFPGVGHGLARDPVVMAECVDRLAAFARRVLGVKP
jgi:predicted alpha/beta-hydrolase family hydrolase